MLMILMRFPVWYVDVTKWSTEVDCEIRSHFSVKIPKCKFCVNDFFFCTSCVWNTLPVSWFPIGYDLQKIKFRVNPHLPPWSLVFWCQTFSQFLSLLVTSCILVAFIILFGMKWFKKKQVCTVCCSLQVRLILKMVKFDCMIRA